MLPAGKPLHKASLPILGMLFKMPGRPMHLGGEGRGIVAAKLVKEGERWQLGKAFLSSFMLPITSLGVYIL